ncbi:mechanosensitive ion channel protein 10 isoform X1 [Cinnamomum micranthum f. kanehirae]|uniref:Mechanosensitive ion channel protein n=1 Tax=Cinnamomum micranthum f. kanehirae TaxID=337451 RepID=A0A3S3MGM7_9MAGN|nr:mechanosensitive ion channel protein 10 isoform X1 [Cinnamomum micranthum f. kanehirae]
MESIGRPLAKGQQDEVVLLIEEEEEEEQQQLPAATASLSSTERERMDSKNAGSCSFTEESESPIWIHQSEPSNGAKDSDAAISDVDRLRSKVSVATSITSPSPETPILLSPSPNKPPSPRSPSRSENLTRRRSVFSKPKSRFVEPFYPVAVNQIEESGPPIHHPSPNSPFQGLPNQAPKDTITSTVATPQSIAVEEEEEEIYKTGYIPGRKKLKFRVLVEWVTLISATSLLIASSTVQKLQPHVIWGLELWKWSLMVMVIFCGRLVTDWFIQVIVFLIEKNFILKKKVLYFVYGLKNSVQICIWSALVLLNWFLLVDHGKKRAPATIKVFRSITRTLASVLIGGIIWLLKILLMKIIASSFHVNTFFDRIKESIFHQYVLQTLSGPPMKEMAERVGSTKSNAQLSFRSMEKGRGSEERSAIDVGKLHKMKQDEVSAWAMRRLVKMVTNSELSTISSSIESVDENRGGEITNELEAKAAAFQIFRNVAKPDCKYIDEVDLMKFLRKQEVASVFPQFEGAAETGKVEKSALRNWVVKVYLERKALGHSLNDTKTAVKQLNKLVTGIVVIVMIITWMVVMGFANSKVLVFISSQLVLVAFMFGNTCKTIFEAIIFVFIMHPFDVGDRCVVDGVQMIVEEMNILTTVFLRYDNEKIYYPNATLAAKPISNFYRSPDMGDAVEFSVDVSTSMEIIGALKDRIKTYIESKPRRWHHDHLVVVRDILNLNEMKMALYLQHTINHQDMGEKTNRRSELIIELKKIFEELKIKYHLMPQEVHLSYVGSTTAPMAAGRL